jgi:hypothetical protein
MINYSIPKAHVLCGHFVKINNESEYNEMKAIAEGCGFEVVDSYNSSKREIVGFAFNNDMTVKWYSIHVMSGQEVSLTELKKLAELSKIELPCDMEVWNAYPIEAIKRKVIGFYKGCALAEGECILDTTLLWKHFRPINPNAKEIAKIETEIEALQAKLNTLKALNTK